MAKGAKTKDVDEELQRLGIAHLEFHVLTYLHVLSGVPSLSSRKKQGSNDGWNTTATWQHVAGRPGGKGCHIGPISVFTTVAVAGLMFEDLESQVLTANRPAVAVGVYSVR